MRTLACALPMLLVLLFLEDVGTALRGPGMDARLWGAPVLQGDAAGPTMGTTDPNESGVLAGSSYTLKAKATDPCGVLEMCFHYVYCGAAPCDDAFSTATQIACDRTRDADGYFSAVWTYPLCGEAPNNIFNVWFEAKDQCNSTTELEMDDQVLSGRGC